MKINVTQAVMGLDGKELPVSNEDRVALIRARDLVAAGNPAEALPLLEQLVGIAEPLTFRKVAVQALMASMKGDENLDGEKKLKMWQLASRIQGEDEPDIDTGPDVTLLKERIGKAYGPVVVGPAFLILNGTPASETKG